MMCSGRYFITLGADFFTASIHLDGSRVYQMEGLNRTVEACLATVC